MSGPGQHEHDHTHERQTHEHDAAHEHHHDHTHHHEHAQDNVNPTWLEVLRHPGRYQLGPRYFLTNLDAPMPWPRKLWLLARNMTIRAVRVRPCCGHPGEPGC